MSPRTWEIRREDWRRLRHDRALVNFHAELQAQNFTNPPERVSLFRGYKSGQSTRHEKRVMMLEVLCKKRPGAEVGTRLTGEISQRLGVKSFSAEWNR